MSQPNRVTGVGGAVSYGGAAVTGRTSWSFGSSLELEEVGSLAYAWKQRTVVDAEWEASVELELALNVDDLTPVIGIGTLTGALLEDYKFNVSAEIAEPTGQLDPWKVKYPTGYDASLDINKWISGASYGAFVAALVAQIADGGSQPTVAVVTPFGSFAGLYDTAGIDLDSKTLKESGGVKLATAAFTAGTYFPEVFDHIAAANAALIAGAGVIPTAGALALPCGNGLAYVESIELEVPKGHVTGTINFVGTDAFTPTA
ncbi:MAG: hypothetical protein KAJ37_11835 [Candidatus Krumholzibacteria bacterium]|nr:hypothetical protein [Candidatus Krumholzibacteria bacterium]